MILVGVRNEPQGPAYLPPSPRPGGGGTGHPDDWAGVSMYYIFSKGKRKNRKFRLDNNSIVRDYRETLYLRDVQYVR